MGTQLNTEPKSIDRLLSVPALAKAWGVSPRTIWRKIETGALPVVRLTPHCTRVRESVAAEHVAQLESSR